MLTQASILLVAAALTLIIVACAEAGPNYDEAKVPRYTLPDPLTMADGTKVATAEQWRGKRRAELLRLFEQHMYGRTPADKVEISCRVIESDGSALGGKARRKQVRISFDGNASAPAIDVLLYLPKDAKDAAPAFLGLNFRGNHAVNAEAAIVLPRSWISEKYEGVTPEGRATEKGRGTESSRWPAEEVVKRGYCLATAYYGDIEPDRPDGVKDGVRKLFPRPAGADSWGAIGAWAWGLSRILDYLQTDRDVDANRVVVLGHSRLGKTALWAAAQDERFAMAISNDSGCGGASLARRQFGETVAAITRQFPQWFCERYRLYAGREAEMPVDQHELIALAAPRPVYVASAQGDQWADPRGEFLSCVHADPVYRLLGTAGLPAAEMPALSRPVMGRIGYHIRPGKHDLTAYDWACYLDFADKHFGKTKNE